MKSYRKRESARVEEGDMVRHRKAWNGMPCHGLIYHSITNPFLLPLLAIQIAVEKLTIISFTLLRPRPPPRRLHRHRRHHHRRLLRG